MRRREPRRAGTPSGLRAGAVLAALLGMAARPAGAATTIGLAMRASGAVATTVDASAAVDDAHLCTAFDGAAGRHAYMLRYAAATAATLLDPGSPGLLLTFSSPEGVTGRLAPHEGSIQVAIGGRRFFGASQADAASDADAASGADAAFGLALSLRADGAGGSFAARHLVDESGRQSIDITGEWRCPPPARAGAGAQALAEVAPSPAAPAAQGDATRPDAAAAVRPEVAPIPRPAPVVQTAGAPASAPAGAARAVPAPAPALAAMSAAPVPVAPPAAAASDAAPFRQLLAALGHDAAGPGIAAPPLAAPAFPAPASSPPASPASGLFATRRVFIHYRRDSAAGAAAADQLARRLDPAFAHIETRIVPATPDVAEIRYFFAADAAAARALAERLGATDGPWQVHSFTTYQPSPAPGTLELWVPAR